MAKPKIVVVGSMNIDFVLPVPRMPIPGETLAGGNLKVIPGGKGANQACAASLLGGDVSLIGQLGDDSFRPLLIESLEKAGVRTDLIGRSALPTGSASIYVTPDGQNSIVISAGANGTLDPQTAVRRLDLLNAGDIVLLQLEIPLETTEAVARVAHQRNAIVILDPAPVRPLPPGIFANVDFLTPNQTEACGLTERSAPPREAPPPDAELAAALLALGARTVVLKMGSSGCLLAGASGVERYPAFRVKVVDTTAAGDVFNGAFAVALSEGRPLSSAAVFGNAAAALSVTRQGAQTSIPTRSEVAEFMASVPHSV